MTAVYGLFLAGGIAGVLLLASLKCSELENAGRIGSRTATVAGVVVSFGTVAGLIIVSSVLA